MFNAVININKSLRVLFSSCTCTFYSTFKDSSYLYIHIIYLSVLVPGYFMHESEPKPWFWRACGAPTSLINGCQNLFIYLDYLEFVVILHKKIWSICFLPEIVSFNKDDILNILGIYRIRSRINTWTGKVILNWNYYKIM